MRKEDKLLWYLKYLAITCLYLIVTCIMNGEAFTSGCTPASVYHTRERQPHIPSLSKNNEVEKNKKRGQAPLVSEVPCYHLFLSYLHLCCERGSFVKWVHAGISVSYQGAVAI